MSKTVNYKVDLNNPPVLSDEQKARLDALAKRPDSEIDCSDIPALDESFWKEGETEENLTYTTLAVPTIKIDMSSQESGITEIELWVRR